MTENCRFCLTATGSSTYNEGVLICTSDKANWETSTHATENAQVYAYFAFHIIFAFYHFNVQGPVRYQGQDTKKQPL